MDEAQTILVTNTGYDQSLRSARKGTVHILLIHGTRYSPELRANPPRIRLLDDHVQGKYTQCELLDPWPDAPVYWPFPPESDPAEVAREKAPRGKRKASKGTEP